MATAQQPEWELRKENAAPLARGRNASTLSRALSSTSQIDDDTRRTNDKRLRQFERLVQPSERAAEFLAEKMDLGEAVDQNLDPLTLLDESERGDNNDNDEDPLVHWLSYIKFHQEAYPSDTRTQFLLLERCARTLVTFPRYRDDVRFIRACVLYADKTSCPSDIFKFLHQRGVGGKTALFWIAWAWVAEKANDFRFAEKVFLKGISKKAKPTKMLEQRHKQFQRRMSRHWLNNTTLDQATIDVEAADASDSSRRGALSGLTDGGVRRNHRARSSNSDLSFSSGMQRGNNGHGWGQQQLQQQASSNSTSTFSTRRATGSSGSGGGGRPNSVMAKAGFSIFVDENDDDNGGGYDLDRSRDHGSSLSGGHGRGGGVGSSRRIATESDRVKENEGRTERWNERGGLNDDDDEEEHDHYAQPQQRPAAPTFVVFVDDKCAAENEPEEEEKLKRQRERKKKEEGDGRSLRQRMDGGVADRLQRDPLRYMRNPSKQSSDRAKYGDDVAASAKKVAREDALPPRSGKKSSRSTTTTTTTANKSKLPCGFDKTLCEKDANGQECCFEEARARASQYKLVTPESDFNLLKVEQVAVAVQRQDDSAMDVDSSSIIDVDMEDDDDHDVDMESAHQSPKLNVSIHHKSSFTSSDVNGTGLASGRKAPMPKRVLFGRLDTSINSQPTPLNASAVSAASSTVDERNAVGVMNMGKEEETINTKFAMKELSMMFASPAGGGGVDDSDAEIIGGGGGGGGGGQGREVCPLASKPLFSLHTARKARCNLTPASEAKVSVVDETDDNGDTATFSVVADLINGNRNKEEEEQEETENNDPRNPLARSMRTPGFDTCALRALDNGEVDAIAEERRVLGESSAAVGQVDGAEGPTSMSQIGRGGGGQAVAFEIFCHTKGDCTSSTVTGGGGSEAAAAAPFTIFRDPTIGHDGVGAAQGNANYDSSDDDSSCDDEGGGNTATFGEIGEAFKDLVAAAGESSDSGKAKAKPFSIFEDDAPAKVEAKPINHRRDRHQPMGGLVDVQQKAGGFSIFCDDDNTEDDDDTDNKISPREHVLNDEDTRDGFGVDISRIAPASPDNITISTALLPEMAVEYHSTHQRDMKTAQRGIFSDCSASIIDYRSQDIPRGFRGTKPVKGAEIDLDKVTAVVQHELGRGANGVVLLCHSKHEGESFSSNEDQHAVALKVQSPVGCLAHEHNLLRLLDSRVPQQDVVVGTKKRRSRKRRSSGTSSTSSNGNISPALPFPKPFSFVAFKNGGLLGMTAGSSSGINLLDLVLYCKKSGEGSVHELVAIHYTSRMLKHMELLHWHGKILHCDVKPDNWVLVASSSACGTGSDAIVQGSDLMLVDFGRAVDLVAAAKSNNRGDALDVRFSGNEAAKDMECVAMREGLSWGLDVDTYGLCASAFILLYGDHMDVIKDTSTKRWRPHKPLRRYWNKELWSELFDTLINIGDGSKDGALGSHPNSLRQLRKRFDGYLDEGNRRAHLESYLKHQAGILPKLKKK